MNYSTAKTAGCDTAVGQTLSSWAYWAEHLRGTVRFADAVSELWREPGRVLVEVGPAAARLLDHLAAFLAAALAAPERPLAELPLLSTSERRQLLAWSDGGQAGEAGEEGQTGEDGQAGAQPPLVHHAFFSQAARTPGAPAVVAGGAEGREVSYGELARLARGLARRLVARGIGPESRVAIALERSPRMVAAVFAVLTAGGAYVPLDPASPVERLAVILMDISGIGRDTVRASGAVGAVARRRRCGAPHRRRARGGARGGQARRPARSARH